MLAERANVRQQHEIMAKTVCVQCAIHGIGPGNVLYVSVHAVAHPGSCASQRSTEYVVEQFHGDRIDQIDRITIRQST